MTDEQQADRDGDGRHDFRAATTRADQSELVDDEGHDFMRGRVSSRDEADRE